MTLDAGFVACLELLADPAEGLSAPLRSWVHEHSRYALYKQYMAANPTRMLVGTFFLNA
jgi:hypothetical protein